jgi:hypothetical protein
LIGYIVHEEAEKVLESVTDLVFGVCAPVHIESPVMLHSHAVNNNDWASRWDLDANQERDVGAQLVIQ